MIEEYPEIRLSGEKCPLATTISRIFSRSAQHLILAGREEDESFRRHSPAGKTSHESEDCQHFLKGLRNEMVE